MTDNEIIKALECDAISEFDHWVLDLINRQKAEIERLTVPKELIDDDFCGVVCEFAEELIKKAKAEAIKEFAERLKNEASEKVGIDEDFLYYDFGNKFKTFYSVADVIEFLSAIVVKEMVGETDV